MRTPSLKPSVEAELLAQSKQAHDGNFVDFSPAFSNVAEAVAWLEDELKKSTVISIRAAIDLY